jgi:hypothetical protein
MSIKEMDCLLAALSVCCTLLVLLECLHDTLGGASLFLEKRLVMTVGSLYSYDSFMFVAKPELGKHSPFI